MTARLLAGFSTPTLNGNFTLEKSLPVIIFSYEPTGSVRCYLHCHNTAFRATTNELKSISVQMPS